MIGYVVDLKRTVCFVFLVYFFVVLLVNPIGHKKGINDLAHLNDKISTHIKSSLHINAHLNLKLLGKQDIRQQLSNAFRTQKHNETVTNNRYILSKIIDCIKLCGAFELAL